MKKIKIGDCFDALDHDRPLVCVDIVEANDWPWIVAGSTKYMLNPNIYPPIPTLHLPISEPWFSKILSGEKLEEYRDLKRFYACRLGWYWNDAATKGVVFTPHQDFKVLHLTNGYGHHRPQLWVHIEYIAIGNGKPEWGAPAEDVFIIRLGKVFHTKNLK